jgi:hypothetical protein
MVEGEIGRVRPGVFESFGDNWGVRNGCPSKRRVGKVIVVAR